MASNDQDLAKSAKLWLFHFALVAASGLVFCQSLRAQSPSDKLGWAGGGNIQGEVNPSNANWYYSWWHNKPAGNANANAEWIPLIKYVNGNFQNNLNIVAGYNDVDTLLVLNEPERVDQSNVSVATALSVWPQVQTTLPNHKLVSPAVSDTQDGRDWLDAFFAQVDASNGNADPNDDLRVDAVAFHWYGSDSANNPVGAANNFLNRVDWYHTQYNRPVWITEFAIHDWNENETDAAILNANRIFLETVIPGLESRSYVEKYAYYSYFDDAKLFEGNPVTPNGPGDVYVGTLQAGESFDLDGVSQGTDVFYFRGGELKNEGAVLGSALRALDTIEGSSTIGGSSDWALTGDSFVRVRANSTLTKTGANTITWQYANNDIDGDLNVTEGTLYVDGGSFEGAGTTRVAENATLEFRAPGGRGSYLLAGQELEVSGTLTGSLLIADGTTLTSTSSNALVSGIVTVSNATINVGGNGFNEAVITESHVTNGLQLNFDAGHDTPGDAEWTNVVDPANSIAFDNPATPNLVNGDAFPALTVAYSPLATGGAAGLANYFETNGPRSRQDASFEVVFEVDGTSTGSDQVILETGGAGLGVAFVMNGSELRFNVDGLGVDSDIDLYHNLSDGWHQAVGVIELDTTGNPIGDSITLYIDGEQVGNITGQVIDDWSGGNPLGIGDGADSATGVSTSPGEVFEGQVAIGRFYGNTALSAADVAQNYRALTGEGVASSMHFDSNLSLSNNSNLQLDISAGGSADKLLVDGQLGLIDVDLEVSQVGNDPMAAGEIFDLFDAAIVSGDFDSITLPALEAGLMWNVDSLSSTGEILVTLAGDYNGDGNVDAADYTVWRDSVNQQVTPYTAADGNGDGQIDVQDQQVWAANYGATIVGFGQNSASTSVPEPSAIVLLLWLIALGASLLSRPTLQEVAT